LGRLEFWTALREHALSLSSERDLAFEEFSVRGGYPLVHKNKEVPWAEIATQLNETVIRQVIEHDLRVGDPGHKRDAPLLDEVFRLACRHAGKAPAPASLAHQAQGSLGTSVAPEKINHFLEFLGDIPLLRLIRPLETQSKRKGQNAKICVVDHGLRASWLQELVPVAPRLLKKEPGLSVLAGHLSESIVGAAFSTIPGLDIAHLPASPDQPEVDFVLTIGARRIPVEVKYRRRIDPLRDTEGLRTFLEKAANHAPFGLLITLTDNTKVVDPRIVSLPLSSLMLLR
jgi:predicted AAA+ superfamily ATPase